MRSLGRPAAEALTPDVLADILRTAIGQHINRHVYERVLRRERQERRALSRGSDNPRAAAPRKIAAENHDETQGGEARTSGNRRAMRWS